MNMHQSESGELPTFQPGLTEGSNGVVPKLDVSWGHEPGPPSRGRARLLPSPGQSSGRTTDRNESLATPSQADGGIVATAPLVGFGRRQVKLGLAWKLALPPDGNLGVRSVHGKLQPARARELGP
jgi:hypothetical protein